MKNFINEPKLRLHYRTSVRQRNHYQALWAKTMNPKFAALMTLHDRQVQLVCHIAAALRARLETKEL